MTSNLLIEMGASRLATGDDRDGGVVLVRIPERLYEKIHAAIVRGETDAERLDHIASEYLHVVPFDMPTGAGDADVGWDVLQSTTGMPDPALLARVFEDDPRKAIDAAIANGFRAVNADGTP